MSCVSSDVRCQKRCHVSQVASSCTSDVTCEAKPGKGTRGSRLVPSADGLDLEQPRRGQLTHRAAAGAACTYHMIIKKKKNVKIKIKHHLETLAESGRLASRAAPHSRAPFQLLDGLQHRQQCPQQER